jgi:hypothetical protein
MRLVIAASVAALTLAIAPSAHARKDYGTAAGMAVQVERGPVGCPTARGIVRSYSRSKAPCAGSSCRRSVRGWTCQSSPAFAFPRLLTCSRGSRRVVAYSRAD